MIELLKTTKAYNILKNSCIENTNKHAYMLVFDDDRNLSLALKEFAKLFFINNNDFQRINHLIDENNFSDCLFYPDDGKKLLVDDVESIIEESTLKPVEGNVKLFVIGDFSTAVIQAQNKLLKLLEEPPVGVYFLLGATVTYTVLPTILSRTSKLEIPPFSEKETVKCLKRLYPYHNELRLYAAVSGCIIGKAQNIIDGIYYKELVDDAFALTNTDPFRLPILAKKLNDIKYKSELLNLLRLIFRDTLMIKISSINGTDKTKKNIDDLLVLKPFSEKLKELSEYYQLNSLIFAQSALSETEKQIKFNGSFSSSIEVCIAKILATNTK